MPIWLKNVRRLDRALWLIFVFLGSMLFTVVGIAVIIKSPESGDKLFGVILTLLGGVSAIIWFQKLKRLYREAISPARRTCPGCRQEFTVDEKRQSEGLAHCPYCGHLVQV